MAAIHALFGLFMAAVVTGQIIDIIRIIPKHALKRVGDELTVLCTVPYPINSCTFNVGMHTFSLQPHDNEGDVIYYGQGLSYGECGVILKDIREEYNGGISCVLTSPYGNSRVIGIMRLTVARAPRYEPLLIFPQQEPYSEGDNFEAECVVSLARPAAKVTWFLGNQELLEGLHRPSLTTKPGSDLVAFLQYVSRKLTADDDNLFLTCRVEHPALEKPIELKRKLIVNRRLSPTLDASGNQLTR